VSNIPKDFVAILPEHSSAKDVRQIGARDLQALKPSHGGF
jgi:hypothetical protein